MDLNIKIFDNYDNDNFNCYGLQVKLKPKNNIPGML